MKSMPAESSEYGIHARNLSAIFTAFENLEAPIRTLSICIAARTRASNSSYTKVSEEQILQLEELSLEMVIFSCTV